MTSIKRLSLYSFFILINLLVINIASAHHPDQSYLYLRIYGEGMGGRIELSGPDINRAIGSSLPDDDLSFEMITPYIDQIHSYLISRTSFSSGGKKYAIKFEQPTLFALGEEQDHFQFHFAMEGVTVIPEYLDVEYRSIFDVNPEHRGMMIIEYNWKAGIIENHGLISAIFSPGDMTERISLTETSIWKGFIALIKLGAWHIWIGLDHILFLVALILPAVVRRKEEDGAPSDALPIDLQYDSIWSPVKKFKPAFFYILKIITFFTIAHSITLAIAALGFINLSSRWVESIIAISIALAALHNIIPVFKAKEWLVAFVFGLFHGFGFASVLGDKGLDGDFMVLSLLGFNIGVEIGQVLIICLIFPVLYFIRKQKLYPAILKYGSMVLIFISLYWFIERAFEVDLPLGAYFWKLYHAILG